MFTNKLNSLNFDSQSYFFNELSKIMNQNNKNNSHSSTHSNYSDSSHSTEQNIIIQSTIKDNSVITDDNNLCLITKDILHPNHITLSCGHKFNYLPLYKEVVNQKNKSNTNYEITKLDNHQIKCPYCRRITNNLLPFIPYTSVKLIKYVNCPEQLCMPAVKCSHTFRRRNKSDSNSDDNIDYNNDSGNEFITNTNTNTNSTTKEYRCDKNAIYYETEKVLFCQHHYKLYQKKASLAQLKKVKNETAKTNNDTLNPDIKRCNAILKSGKNSGKKCHNTILTCNSLYCKRHASICKE